MFMFKSYIDPAERQSADRQLGRLLGEGLLLGGTGLGILALIFEIAADAFSVAAYQTLLAVLGAGGYHDIAIMAFIVLSVMLFLGIVPAYKAGAYLRPNAGGSGPLVEAIGPPRLRWLSWVGTSLFFMDAVLTIIISSISAADVTMLLLPELAEYRILLAEVYAFFIMIVLVSLGPKRAVPLFLLGGGAFTLFTIAALTMVGATAAGNPEWAFLTEGIVNRLSDAGVVEHIERAAGNAPAIGSVLFFQFFFRSMSSAMLGFSGYEVIPASGKHAARPKWKVINTALTMAAVFLIGTGVIQLFAAKQWNIPATEGYSTLLIEYEIVAAQVFGSGIEEDDIRVTDSDRQDARQFFENLSAARAEEVLQRGALHGGESSSENEEEHGDTTVVPLTQDEYIDELAYNIAFARTISQASGTSGTTFLTIAGILLAIILLLAQGGGYVGGAAVAANAARLGRLPSYFSDDRIGIAVIWGVAAIVIPIIREVVIVEAYYAFGFVSAFMITSTTVFFVRDEVLKERGLKPGSAEVRSLKFAGLRGMIASYSMGIILVTQKTDALGVIVIGGIIITLLQLYIASGKIIGKSAPAHLPANAPGTLRPVYATGVQRAHDEARQRGLADRIHDMIEEGKLVKFNVEPERIQRLVSHLHNVRPELFNFDDHHEHHERYEEPSVELEETYQDAYGQKQQLLDDIEHYSHWGIFTFIDKYHVNWINPEHGRDKATVQKAMINILFPMSNPDEIWEEYCNYEWGKLPEPIWQFSRERYRWAKDQWPNLSDRITTIWVLQDFGLIPDEVDVTTVISVSADNRTKTVEIQTHGPEENGDASEADTTSDTTDDRDIE